jgi:hypothetical protein
MGDYCFSGGVDGTVRCWNLPPPTVDPYDTFDASVMFAVFEGGTKNFFIFQLRKETLFFAVLSYSTPVLSMNKGSFCSVVDPHWFQCVSEGAKPMRIRILVSG